MTLVIETNAHQLFQEIFQMLRDAPRILQEEQDSLRSIIHDGMWEQFEALSREEGVTDASGEMVAWYPVKPMTALIRVSHWGLPPDFRGEMNFNPLMVVTGALRSAVTSGATVVTKEGDEMLMTYIPSGDQNEKIDKHEAGFHVTFPEDIGKRSAPRPMMFWGESLADAVTERLDRALDNHLKARGF